MSEKRIAILDVLKLFAIFLVVWGHCIQYFQSDIYYNQPVYRVIYSFHMPLFMMLVGFFSNFLKSISLKKIIIKKFIQLLLPAITAGTLIWIIFIREISIETFKNLVLNNFWFLKSAFICCILYSISFNIESKTKKIIYIAFTLLISQFFSIYQLYLMYPSFLLGIIFNIYYSQFKFYKNIILILSGILFILLLLNWNASNWLHGNTIPLSLKIYNRAYRLTIGLIGSTFFMSLFETLSKSITNKKTGSILSKYGRYTLGIYIFQTFIIEITLKNYICLDNLDFISYNFIICPLLSLLIISLIIICIKKLNKVGFISFLLFGKINKK